MTQRIPESDTLRFGVRREFDDCVHCGLCLNACPTYLEIGQEPDSPRGRIYLMKGLSEGRFEATPDVVRHLELCLGCRACETACPSGVQYGHLLEETRAWLREPRDGPRPLSLLQRVLIGRIMTHPGLFRLSIQATRLAERVGLAGLIGLVMPKGFDAAAWARRMTLGDRVTLDAVYPAAPPVRGRVALLTGCVMDGLFSRVNETTARLLAREGWEVHVPRGQVCCGALPAHAGLREKAQDLARTNVAAFLPGGAATRGAPAAEPPFDFLVTNAAGCGAQLKEYDALLSGEVSAERRRGATALAARARDVSQVLALHELRGPLKPRPVRAVYHDACHLAHGQRVTVEPRALLAQVPGLELLPLPEADLCCGSAGSYNITEAETARRLGRRKADRILGTGAELVIAANAGCLMQIKAELDAAAAACEPARKAPRVRHLVEVLGAGE